MYQYINIGIATLVAVGVYAWFSTSSLSKIDQVVDDSQQNKDVCNNTTTKPNEAQIMKTKCILLVLSNHDSEEVKALCESFCGTVITECSSEQLLKLSKKTVYLCGNISIANNIKHKLDMTEKVYIIKEISSIDNVPLWPIVCLGRVPILIHDVGVLYPCLFDDDDEENDYFNRIRAQHAFQSLTESNKPGTALRTGIYLSPVKKVGEDELHFNLLRCSTNLSGPTGNFQSTDHHIIDMLNNESSLIFGETAAPLNHVLAQIYRNKAAVSGHKQTKAKIKEHSDKTKDMPLHGIMAFVTFYDELNKLEKIGKYDYGNNKGVSGLTTLRFRLKKEVLDEKGTHHDLNKDFSVTLYPNSVFFMPLSTNRLYTHEIVPSKLMASMLPTRMGYVVRCSNVEAVFKDNTTYLKNGFKKLENTTVQDMNDLRKKYADENLTTKIVNYGSINFSMNNGDYKKPFLNEHEEFRTFSLNLSNFIKNQQQNTNNEKTNINIFNELMSSAPFEFAGKGREGAVLVKPSEEGIPIVRTTTKYLNPSQVFKEIHINLANQIEKIGNLSKNSLNNCLIENYLNTYKTMGYHSDQSLDLEPNSTIALYSCYEHPNLLDELLRPPRMLIIEPKDENVTKGGDENKNNNIIEIPLPHNSVVLFSVKCNKKFRHKIVLDVSSYQPENTWLGCTFRCSKTFIKYHKKEQETTNQTQKTTTNQEEGLEDSNNAKKNMECLFEDGTPLQIFNENERREFYSLRSRENKEIDFEYPDLRGTLSESDLMPPTY